MSFSKAYFYKVLRREKVGEVDKYYKALKKILSPIQCSKNY